MSQQRTSWSDDVRPASPREHGEMRSGSETASTPTSTVSDPHLSMIRQVYPQTPNGCEECLRLGTEWVHLRLCLTCGHVGCCDSSPLRHAMAIRLAFERIRPG